MKNKKNIIVIVIALVLLILVATLIYYGVNKKSNLITEDTLFLCPGEAERYHVGNGVIELVKASDNKHENEVCDGKSVGKYVCTNKNCDYQFYAQSFDRYIDYNKGIATIYDNNEEHYALHGFLYDFKNSKKLTEEMEFSMVAYEDNSKVYFAVSQDSNEGVVDNQGNMMIDFGKYDDIDFYTGFEYNPVEVLKLDGIYAVNKNNKYGFVDVTTGKETTKIEFDQYGYVGTDNNILRFVTKTANRNSKEIYVVSNNVGKIVNYKTGEVTRTLNKVYDYVFPLSKDLILVEEGNDFDILDENNKSVLKKKLTFNNAIDLYWDKENSDWDNYDFKKFKIVIINNNAYSPNGHGYIFDIDSRTLMEY